MTIKFLILAANKYRFLKLGSKSSPQPLLNKDERKKKYLRTQIFDQLTDYLITEFGFLLICYII